MNGSSCVRGAAGSSSSESPDCSSSKATVSKSWGVEDVVDGCVDGVEEVTDG
jgi:hypothetical protein